MHSIEDVVRSSEKVSKFDKYLKKAGGHIGLQVVEITIKMKTIVRKPFIIKIIFSALLTYSIVTLYRWPAKQTIPLSVLVRNQTKGFWT